MSYPGCQVVPVLVATLAVMGAGGCSPAPEDALPTAGGPPEPVATEERGELAAAAGFTVIAALAAGERHAYSVELPDGRLLALSAGQLGVDVELELTDPTDRPITRVDTPTGTRGRERLLAVSGVAGRHRLTVAGLGGRGGYALRIETVRPATAADRELAAAALALDRAEHARLNGPETVCHQVEPDYREAIGILAARPGHPEREARARLGLGLCLAEVGDPEEAAMQLEAAANRFAVAGLLWDRAWALRDLGRVLRRVSRPRRAWRALDRSVALFAELGDAGGEAAALLARGELAAGTSAFEEALGDFERSLDLARAAGSVSAEAAALGALGRLYALIGYTEEALDHLHPALELQRSAGDDAGRLATLTQIGWVHYLDLDPADSVPCYAEALAIAGHRGDRGAEAGVLDRLGSALLELGYHDEAESAYRAALARFRRLKRSADEGATLGNLGRLMLARGRPRDALPLLGQSIARLAAAGDRNGAIAAEVDRARAERRLGEPDRALARLERQIAELATLRRGLRGETPRALYTGQRREATEESVDLLFELWRLREDDRYLWRALEIAEASRARGLVEGLTGAGLGLRGAEPRAAAGYRELSRRFREADAERRNLVRTDAPAGRIAAAEARVRALGIQLDRARDALGRMTADLAPEPLTASDVRELADAETAFLVYLLAEERSFLWVVTEGGVEGYTLPGRATIEARTRSALRTLARSRHPLFRARSRALTAALTRDLLAPAAAGLDARRLVVLADGALHTLPFGVLPIPGSGAGGAPERPLLAEHEVVTLPSFSVLALQRRLLAGRAPAPRTLVVFADPVFTADDPRLSGVVKAGGLDSGDAAGGGSVVRAARDLDLDRLGRLRYSRDEALALAAMVPAGERLVALDFDASRQLALSGVLSDFRIVHLAGHGFLNTVHPALSGVVLSLFDERGRPLDGFVRAHELRELDLSADLVVLSACRTGLGHRIAGEGVLGVTRGLLLAGARRVVVSHWDVGDRATRELMVRFYQAMRRDGLAPAAALRAAELSMYDDPDWSAPADWGAFTLHGDWR